MQATTVRVGSCLGDGKPQAARAVTVVALCASLGIGGFIGLGFVLLRSELGRLYSSDPAVIALTKELCWIVGPTYILLSIFFVSVATLEGQGRALALALSFLIGAWGVTVPTSWTLSHVQHHGLVGIWLGLVAGYAVITVLSLVACVKSDWTKLSARAVERSSRRSESTAASDVSKAHRGVSLEQHEHAAAR